MYMKKTEWEKLKDLCVWQCCCLLLVCNILSYVSWEDTIFKLHKVELLLLCKNP